MTASFDSKDPSEKVVLTFDFTNGLATGESLSGTPTVTVALVIGTDASPNSILNGAASISGKTVLQPVQAGAADADYKIKVVVSTSNAQKVLALSATLPVRN